MIPNDLMALEQEAGHMAADSIAKGSKFVGKLMEFTSQSAEDILKQVTAFVLETAGKIVLALLIYYLGRLAIKWARKFLKKAMGRHKVDVSLQRFVLSCTQVLLIIILAMTIIGILGINTTSIIAIFASAGLGIGMALSGTLQNFAGGVMILLTKTYRIGDYIETQGQAGNVKEIKLFHTHINTSDNKTVVIPNGMISNGIINNYTAEPNRRVEWVFGISYGDDYDVAKDAITEILLSDGRVLKDRDYLVAMKDLAASSVNIVVRAWVPAAEFWNVYFDINEIVYKTLPQKNIHFPFPQMDVNLKKPS